MILSIPLRKIAQHRPLPCTHTHTATHGHVAGGSRIDAEMVHLNLDATLGKYLSQIYLN